MADGRTAEQLSQRLFQAALGTLDLLHVHIGNRLGLYRALADGGPATSEELAARAGIDGRYAQEWLEQQAVTGILEVSAGSSDAERRKFALPSAYAETLVNEESLNFLSPVAGMSVSVAQRMPALLDAYRSGRGIPWEAYGDEMRQGQAAMNRPVFTKLLGQQYLPAIPEIHRRLSEPEARVADIACGAGWSSIAIARAYPAAQVDGFDLDEPALLLGRKNAKEAGVADRVNFSSKNIVDEPSARGKYE